MMRIEEPSKMPDPILIIMIIATVLVMTYYIETGFLNNPDRADDCHLHCMHDQWKANHLTECQQLDNGSATMEKYMQEQGWC